MGGACKGLVGGWGWMKVGCGGSGDKGRMGDADLGDLMRLWVRARVKIRLLLGFSWAAASAPVFSYYKKFYQRLSPTSKQDVSRGYRC